MNKIIPIALMLIILVGCNDKEVVLRNFSSDSWQADSLGCANYRKKTYENLIDQKDVIIGLTESKIVELLGLPNLSKQVDGSIHMFYYIETGFQCIDSVEKTPDRLAETPVIFLYLNSDKEVNKIGVMMP